MYKSTHTLVVFFLAREWRTADESKAYEPSVTVSLMLELSPVHPVDGQ